MNRRRSGRCPATGKARFRDHELAVEVLHTAQRSRAWAALAGEISRRREVRVYRCDACHGWHLTSQASWETARYAPA